MQDVAYHLGLCTDGDSINGCVRDFQDWYGVGTWDMAHEYLGGRPPAGEGKSYAGVKLSWLRQRVQMTPGDGAPPYVLRQYARCYIMMMIGGALFPDKTNNIVSLRRDNLEMGGCLPLCKLNRLGQISWDTHARRTLEFRNELDRVGVDDFVWTPYMTPQWRVMEPGWVNEVGEIETWLATVPIVLFMSRDHQIQIVPTRYPGWPTREYADWWAVACRRRFLSPDRLLQDPRGAQLSDDVYPAVTQERDPIVLPRDAPARGRRARMQCPDIRRKGEGASTSGRSDTQPGGNHVDEEAEYRPHEDIPEGGWPRDSRTGRRLLLRRRYRAGSVHPTGRGLSCRIRPASTCRQTVEQFNHYVPPNDMYDVFSCGVSVLPALAAIVLSAFTAAAVSASLALFPVVLPAVTAAGLSVAFIGSAALPAPVQLSHTVAPATGLPECGTAFTPPAAARRSFLPLRAGAIGPPDCPPTGSGTFLI
ncbi:hypothetical protein PIB30_058872 [Stylosanthes scabra]|uniref:Aminotransferase-like plant mobile domain-containing protein n=1 Tax=Stylosanthes scabra TaxID=79078 RepID=A0ABU6UJK5_9FABA|nr:hypothetical protein [Stylosanthes scabra]